MVSIDVCGENFRPLFSCVYVWSMRIYSFCDIALWPRQMPFSHQLHNSSRVTRTKSGQHWNRKPSNSWAVWEINKITSIGSAKKVPHAAATTTNCHLFRNDKFWSINRANNLGHYLLKFLLPLAAPTFATTASPLISLAFCAVSQRDERGAKLHTDIVSGMDCRKLRDFSKSCAKQFEKSTEKWVTPWKKTSSPMNSTVHTADLAKLSLQQLKDKS